MNPFKNIKNILCSCAFYVASLLLVVALAGCSSKEGVVGGAGSSSTVDHVSQKTSASKTLVACKADSPAGFDPAQYVTVFDVQPSAPIFDRLVTFKRGTTTIVPSLAQSWTVSQDGLTYTFHLRRGVQFHTTDYFKPTRALNADDVVFTFSRVLDQQHLFRLAYPAEFPNFEDEDRNLVKVVKIDPYTVQFKLRKPEASILGDLATISSSILSFEYAQQLYRQGKAAEIAQKPVGTGPFMLQRYLKNQQIRYVANKAYWDKRPENQVKVDELVLVIAKEFAVHAKKMQAGECHIVEGLPALDMPKFQHNPNFVVHKGQSVSVGYIAYNTEKHALKKKQVRQALDMALDKKSIVAVYRGFVQPIATILPPIQWGYDRSVKAAPYNPAKAKALLKQAGYPHGFNLKLFIYLGASPANDLIAQIIQDNWTKIGVKVKLVSYDGGEFFKRANEGEHDAIFAFGAGNNGDPTNFLIGKTCKFVAVGGNFARWCYKPFDQLVEKGRFDLSRTERIKACQQAQRMIREEIPLTPLTSGLSSHITHRSVKGYVLPLLTPQQYTGISIE